MHQIGYIQGWHRITVAGLLDYCCMQWTAMYWYQATRLLSNAAAAA